MLRVSHRMIQRMCQKGILVPVYKEANGLKHFHVEEVAALAEIYHQKLDLAEVAALAMRAITTAKANERRLDELYRLMGLQRKTLSTDTTEMLSLYARAEQTLEIKRQPLQHELEDWAASFYAMDENYLRLLELHTASKEPWKVYLDLAAKFLNDRAYEFYDAIPELRAAYEYMEVTRQHLRRVAYMYCREAQGAHVASQAFGTEKLTDRLLAVMF